MKSFALLVIGVVLGICFYGCIKDTSQKPIAQILPEVGASFHTIAQIRGYEINEFVIDGCEYIRYDRGITHKGNCTNSIHIPTNSVTINVHPQ